MKKIFSVCIGVALSVTAFGSGHVATTTQTNITCNGACNGTANGYATGGIGPYGYAWTGPSGFSSSLQNVVALCAGTYTLTATDSSDMSTATATTVITEPLPILVSLPASDTICYGAATVLQAVSTGGVGAYTYSWSPAAGLAATTIWNPACAASSTTTYTVTVTDANGCTGTALITVYVNPQITLADIPLNITCNGLCNGGGVVIPSGGAGTYTYMWMPTMESTASVLGLCAGTQTITVTDSWGCTATDSVTITEPPPISPSMMSSPTFCYGSCDGAASVSASGGVPSYTFLWNDPSGQTTPTANALCAGTWSVTVRDANNCIAIDSVVITEPTPVVIAPIAPSTICSGASVNLVAGATGGNPPYTYIWSPGGAVGGIVIVSPTTTTTYTVMVTDANGCTSAPQAVTIVVDPPMTLSLSSTNTSCFASCDGTATAIPIGGAGPYTYSWVIPPIETTQTATGLCSNVHYGVVVTDSDGCTATDSITLSNDQSPHSNFSMVPDSAAAMSYWAFNTSVGTSLNYIWYFGDGDSSFVASPTHVYPGPGTYNICLIVSNAANAAACFDVVCDSVVVTSTPASCLALFNAARDTADTNPNAYIITDLSYGAALNYSWDFGDGATSTLHYPTHTYAGIGAYQICLTVDNGSGCTQTFCDSISWIDSLAGHSSIPLTVAVVDGPTSPFATGIQEATNDVHVAVYPNPFDDITTFEISGNSTEQYSFEMVDVLGKQVKLMKGITGKTFRISRTGLQNGVYFYKIYNAETPVSIGKLVIQ